MITFNDIKNDENIRTYIIKADEALKEIGYTEHNFAHVGKVADTAAYILSALGYPEREVELAKMAAYMHDIGNLVNRVDHSLSGALMAFRILSNMGMNAAETSTVVTAIGNHDDGTGVPVNAMAAAIIIADKSDVRRSRVRNIDKSAFDIHDRVNYSVTASALAVNKAEKNITLKLTIDTEISSVLDYFDIFLGRMKLCQNAAKKLGLDFMLYANDQRLC